MEGLSRDYIQRFLKIFLLGLFFLMFLASCGEQEEEDPSTTIFFSGKTVLASNINTPIADVTMNLTDMVSNDVTGTITASNGTFTFSGLSQNRWYTIEPVPTTHTFVPEQIQIYTNVNLSDAVFKGTLK